MCNFQSFIHNPHIFSSFHTNIYYHEHIEWSACGNSNQHCETIYNHITHSYLQYSIIQVAATKLWAIKKPFEPAVLFSMSLSWMLWQYTKICLESFHQPLNGVITQSHLVKTYFDDAALILVTFLGTTLLCGAL